jgi:hypothetical protein
LVIRSRRVSTLVLFAASASLHSVPTRLDAQQPPDSDLDLLVNYGYLAAFFDPGIAGFETEGRSVRVLNVPVTFTIRDWKDRGWGLRLRLAGVLGVENLDAIGDIPDARIGAFALIPGLEVPVPLSDRSLLRPFLDVGLAFATEDTDDLTPATIGVTALGLRSEFVFPWRLFELGLEPRLLYSVTWSDEELRDDYGILALRADAQYPLLWIGDKRLTGVVYFQPAWFIDAFDVSSSDMPETSDVRQQYEVGFGWDWRGEAPKIWFLPVPPVGLGFSFGDGLEGIRLRIGGSRMTRLPPETWDHSPAH